MVAVSDMDTENSRIAFATSWTTAGPREDNRNRFGGRNDGNGDEEAARLTRVTWGGAMPDIATCIERQQTRCTLEWRKSLPGSQHQSTARSQARRLCLQHV